MDTIPRLIEYIEKADYKIKEYQENGKTGTEFYKKLRNYREGKQLLYDRIMKRKLCGNLLVERLMKIMIIVLLVEMKFLWNF